LGEGCHLLRRERNRELRILLSDPGPNLIGERLTEGRAELLRLQKLLEQIDSLSTLFIVTEASELDLKQSTILATRQTQFSCPDDPTTTFIPSRLDLTPTQPSAICLSVFGKEVAETFQAKPHLFAVHVGPESGGATQFGAGSSSDSVPDGDAPFGLRPNIALAERADEDTLIASRDSRAIHHDLSMPSKSLIVKHYFIM
jgi:hypothetical protein